MMFFLLNLVVCFNFILSEPINRIEATKGEDLNISTRLTRRILGGHNVGDTRPYMVYLRGAEGNPNTPPDWLCGGVIINEEYILTSAACVENVKHFYIVSGMHSWFDADVKDNECIKNGAKKAVWKCVPKSYVYDGDKFDNIRWMINDIAVVKVEDKFNFDRRIRGCDYVPQKVSFNNQSLDFEKPGQLASIAGWGSTHSFSNVVGADPATRSAKNSEALLETDVLVLSKKNCKKRWPERYHFIIDHNMICGKDGLDNDLMSKACKDQEVSCKELEYSTEDEDAEFRRRVMVPTTDDVVAYNMSRRSKILSGGFCENDHGGPLIVGHGKTSMVIGIMSASMTKEEGNLCYGPFLYTSVYNNRHLISCAIDKTMGATCRKLLRSTKTQYSEMKYDWRTHPDGPAKDELDGDVSIPTKSESTTTTTTIEITTEANSATENVFVTEPPVLV